MIENEIRPINAESRFGFCLQDLTEVRLQDWPPPDFLRLGWNEALKEMNRHWPVLSKALIWSPYPIHGFCVGSAESPSQINALSDAGDTISSLLQFDINEYLKVSVRYFLFPLSDAKFQHQAIAQLICETNVESEIGNINAWVDALTEEELSELNKIEIETGLREL